MDESFLIFLQWLGYITIVLALITISIKCIDKIVHWWVFKREDREILMQMLKCKKELKKARRD